MGLTFTFCISILIIKVADSYKYNWQPATERDKICCSIVSAFDMGDGVTIMECGGFLVQGKCLNISCGPSKSCPRDCVYVYDWCVHRCPDGTYKDLQKPGNCSKCQETCKTCFGPDVSECSSCKEGYFYYKRQCFDHCPNKTYTYRSKCVDKCKQIIYNGNCLDKCPKGTYHTNKTCNVCNDSCFSCTDVKSCTACKGNLVSFEGTCQETCPKIAPYLDNDSCVATCPAYSTDFRCTSSCDYSLFSYHMTCVKSCPYNSRFHDGNMCMGKCPKLVMNLTCTDQCSNGMFQGKDETCVDTCPPDYPIVDEQLKCLKVCDKLQYNNFCYKHCPSEAMVILNGNCTFKCPKSHPLVDPKNRECKECIYYNNTCLLECPPGTFYDNPERTCKPCDSQCQNCFGASARECHECVRFNSSFGCVFSCPSDEPLSVYNFNDKPYCTTECPPGTLYDELNRNCSNECAAGLYRMYNDTAKQFLCLANCPDKYFTFYGKCTKSCSYYSMISEMKCLYSCPVNYVANSSIGYNVVSQKPWEPTECVKCKYYKNTCSRQCPKDTFMYWNTTQFNCLACDTKCVGCVGPTSQDCVACKHFNATDGCVTSCSETASKKFSVHHTDMFGFNSHDYCVQTCPKDLFYDYSAMSCVVKCNKVLNFEYNRTCQSECPSNTFSYHDENSDMHHCLFQCPPHYITFNGSCAINCPQEYPFYNEVNVSCLEQCPDGYVIEVSQETFTDFKTFPIRIHRQKLSKCVTQCSDKYYKLEGQCIKHCSDYIATFNQQKVCVLNCPPEAPYKHYNNCVQKPYAYISDTAMIVLSIFLEVLLICICIRHEMKIGITKLLYTERKRKTFKYMYQSYLKDNITKQS